MVAGLYILAAALRVLPQLKAEGNVFSVPTVSSVELGTWEQAALAQTQTQLEQDLEERFRREAGVSAGVTLALRSASDSVTVDSATVTPAADCTPEQQQAVEKIVEEALGVRPEWNAPAGDTAMKEGQEKTGVFTLRSLLEKQNRTKLAVVLGAAAMILLLLSELLPTNAVKAPVLAPADETAYREQLEKQLQELIEQIDGAGTTTVMITLESGEETVYATDTQSGQTQSQETHVLLEDGTALAQTIYLPQVCGAAVVCDGGGDIRVAAQITELVRALLDLSANRIVVAQRRS